MMRAGLLAVGARSLLSSKTARAARSIRQERAAPRFYIQIMPSGGFDAIYTTDPKTRGEVEPDIDVPFAANDIAEASGMRLGPGFRQLGRWAPRLAIVNAFRQNAANHISGTLHATRFKTHTTALAPTLLQILGGRRQREAVGAINIGDTFATAYSPKYLGEPTERWTFGTELGLFDHLDRADPDGLISLSHVLEREADETSRHASVEAGATATNLRETAALFRGAAVAPRFAPVDWGKGSAVAKTESEYNGGKDFQRALWLIENRLARCVSVSIGRQDFDTHVWNPVYQPRLTSWLGFLLDRLFTELDTRAVDGRPLSEQTAVVVGSEIGRFPRLNAGHGKDHFPQAPYMFFGPWFAGGKTFGETDRNMATRPVALDTGQPQAGGHLLRVDDIGTTLLNLDGAQPERFGYAGEHLTFLTS